MSAIKKIKPSLSKGTRDFLPSEVAKRNYIFDTIKSVFRKYGFEQIETPAIERLETLTGKYGEEGDKLLFKILNSGNAFVGLTPEDLEKIQASNNYHFNVPPVPPEIKSQIPVPSISNLLSKITEKGLRYDLTVPLARYVVQHQDNLVFPFRRFHIAPVWRADRPQKGRYQEFYQCDADIIGSSSLFNEVELLSIYAEVFSLLKITGVELRINNRKIISGVAEILKEQEKFSDIVIAIDKLDKVGLDAVIKELSAKGLADEKLDFLKQFLAITGDNAGKISALKTLLASSVVALKGIEELEFILSKTPGLSPVIDTTLVRGLDYYTGLIVEVKPTTVQMGSLGGGGRYDNLTEVFGGQNMSGVGISFGIERVYDVMEELSLFPDTIVQGVKVLLVPRDAASEDFTFAQVQQLRQAGVPAEIFLGNVKKQKQFDYVEAKNIAFLIEIGENEAKTGQFRLRNAKTRETQNDLTLPQVIQALLNK